MWMVRERADPEKVLSKTQKLTLNHLMLSPQRTNKQKGQSLNGNIELTVFYSPFVLLVPLLKMRIDTCNQSLMTDK